MFLSWCKIKMINSSPWLPDGHYWSELLLPDHHSVSLSAQTACLSHMQTHYAAGGGGREGAVRPDNSQQWTMAASGQECVRRAPGRWSWPVDLCRSVPCAVQWAGRDLSGHCTTNSEAALCVMPEAEAAMRHLKRDNKLLKTEKWKK